MAAGDPRPLFGKKIKLFPVFCFEGFPEDHLRIIYVLSKVHVLPLTVIIFLSVFLSPSSEGLWEMIEGDSEDMCTDLFVSC